MKQLNYDAERKLDKLTKYVEATKTMSKEQSVSMLHKIGIYDANGEFSSYYKPLSVTVTATLPGSRKKTK